MMLRMVQGAAFMASAAFVMAQPAPLEDLLARAAGYVERFETAFSSVVAEERYVQNVMPAGRSFGGG